MRLPEIIRYALFWSGVFGTVNALLWVPLFGISGRILVYIALAVVGFIVPKKDDRLRYLVLGAVGASGYGILILLASVFGCSDGNDAACVAREIGMKRSVIAGGIYLAFLAAGGFIYFKKLRPKREGHAPHR